MANPTDRDHDTLDLHHAPMTMAALHTLLTMLSQGSSVLVVNPAKGGDSEFVHRLELSIVAAHEARVRTARERERGTGTGL